METQCMEQAPSTSETPATAPPIISMPMQSPANTHFSGNAQSPTAPSLDLDMPPPYSDCEKLTSDPEIAPEVPPVSPSNTISDSPPRPYTQAIINITQPKINREQIVDALDDYAEGNICYRNKLKNIRLGRIAVENIFKYTLSTTIEMRRTQWMFVPFPSIAISKNFPGPSHPVGNIWDIVVHPNAEPTEGSNIITITIPGSFGIRPCPKCLGKGRKRCITCLGLGQTNCGLCNGTGERHGHECRYCTYGKDLCLICLGEGQAKCESCIGLGVVLARLELTVAWKVQKDAFISNEKLYRGGEEVPKEKLDRFFNTERNVIFTQTQDRLYPLENFPNKSIQKASQRLLEKHGEFQSNGVIIRKQTHIVQAMQISSIDYRTKAGKTGVFRTYGVNNHVYFPDYPKSLHCSII